MKIRLEFEIPRDDTGWTEPDQGIEAIEFDTADDTLLIDGWYDRLAIWENAVKLTPEQRQQLGRALLDDVRGLTVKDVT